MNRQDLLFAEEVYRITGCAMEVLNALGNGYIEKPYENALAVEFGLRGIPFRKQQRYLIEYKSIVVGEYIPDLIAFDEIVVDTKAVQKIGNSEVGQMLNYLKTTRLHVGVILNFRHAKLEWKRVVR